MAIHPSARNRPCMIERRRRRAVLEKIFDTVPDERLRIRATFVAACAGPGIAAAVPAAGVSR
jgi:hypothetical protein